MSLHAGGPRGTAAESPAAEGPLAHAARVASGAVFGRTAESTAATTKFAARAVMPL